MANLKNITDLPVAESAEGLNLIVNDNGSAKQIAASAVGAQADWAVTDESSPAFIKNKPVEEWDLDIDIVITWNTETSSLNDPVFTVNEEYSYENFIMKFNAGETLKIKIKFDGMVDAEQRVIEMINHPTIMGDPSQPMYGCFWISSTNFNPTLLILMPDGNFDLFRV